VVYRGCAIPVAWTVLAATAKHAWRREWLRMLRQVRRALPRSWTVSVLADRGLYARWLFRRITRLGWHPFLRINTGGTFRPQGQVRGVPLKTFEFIPIKSLAAMGSDGPGSYAGHSRVPSRDHGYPLSIDGSDL
jgi:hypothetical protein